jgi:glycosyltransferase involved in cell wall biosynthesis
MSTLSPEGMPETSESARILASFLLVAYNQENYIREAVEGALSQTYSPLEIILSDDCSKDKTFSIMQQMAANYHGPHKVILNQNERNLGLIGHINRVIPLTTGKWIVMAAGDDISMPERTLHSLKLVLCNERARSVFVGYKPIEGPSDFRALPEHVPGVRQFPETLASHGACGLGACQSIHRDVWDHFGPLPSQLLREDAILPFRASLLGCVVIDSENMVNYRVSPESLSKGYQKRPTLSNMLKVRRGELAEIKEIAKNLAKAQGDGLITGQLHVSTSEKVSIMLNTAEASVRTLEGPRWKRVYHCVCIFFGIPPYLRLCGNW